MSADQAWAGGCYELLFDVGGGEPAPERVSEVAAARRTIWA